MRENMAFHIQELRDRMRSAMIVLDNKQLRKECVPFWMFDFLHSLHNVYRNFIPLVDSKHESFDCVGNTILSHLLVTFLFLQSLINDAHAWKDRQMWSSAWSESGTRSRSFVIAAHCRVNYSPGSPPQWKRRGFQVVYTRKKPKKISSIHCDCRRRALSSLSQC